LRARRGGARAAGRRGALRLTARAGPLITFPALTAVGVPALNANVTNTVALVPGGALGGRLAGRVRADVLRAVIVVLGLVVATAYFLT
jgi:uncharacterized membrane protein YfcA